jgi:hypothetical protein
LVEIVVLPGSAIAGMTPWMGSRIQIAVLPNQISTHGTGNDEGAATEAGGVVSGCPTVTGHEPGDLETFVANDGVGIGGGAVMQAPMALAKRTATAGNETVRAMPTLRLTTARCDRISHSVGVW